MSRLSRIPYSKHQITGLNVVHFTINNSYGEIIRRSRNPRIQDFKREDYTTDFHEHLQKIDLVESYNSQVKKTNLKRKSDAPKKIKNQGRLLITCHFFKSFFGELEREYPEKKYVMYHCPFKVYEDKKPSFMIHEKGYKCYGCGKTGNYYQFIKEYRK